MLTPLNISQDFNDRLVAGDIADYDEYKEFVISKDTQYRPFLVGSDIKAKLERIQYDHFQHRISEMDKPPDMIELLEE